MPPPSSEIYNSQLVQVKLLDKSETHMFNGTFQKFKQYTCPVQIRKKKCLSEITFIVTSSIPSATIIRIGGATLFEFIKRSWTARKEFLTNSNTIRCKCVGTYLLCKETDDTWDRKHHRLQKSPAESITESETNSTKNLNAIKMEQTQWK